LHSHRARRRSSRYLLGYRDVFHSNHDATDALVSITKHVTDRVDRFLERVGGAETAAQLSRLEHRAESHVERIAFFGGVFVQLAGRMDAAQADAARTEQIRRHLTRLATHGAVAHHCSVVIEAGGEACRGRSAHCIEGQPHG
jgi:hypothetical protein